MSVKITGLSKLNVAALRETYVEGTVELTATTATFPGTAQEALTFLNALILTLPGRAHPKASLHAVARKLRAQVLNGPQPVPVESVTPNLDRVLFGQKAAPAEPQCPNTGVTHPQRLRSVCKDCGKEGAVNRGSGTLRTHKPLEITLENLLSY
jgi:hypothetical protein